QPRSASPSRLEGGSRRAQEGGPPTSAARFSRHFPAASRRGLPPVYSRALMATTIAVLSQKGGTGKTTTVRTLADVFRRVGLDVLAVDLDPQGNLSDYFDVPADADPTIADVLSGRLRATDAIHGGIIPANLGLAEAELIL